MTRNGLYTALALAVLLISALPVGIAVFVLGFVYGDSPCVMCWEQRTGMALIALAGLFVLRYGAKPKYVGLSVLIGAWGVFMGIRHTAMHAARDIGQGFSAEILGAHTYTWALFIFWVCVATMGVLLMWMGDEPETQAGPRTLRPLDTLAMVVFMVVIAANAVQAFASTGPPPFVGQGDPIRFSFSPRHWVWSTEEWSPAPISVRGRWAVAKPSVATQPTDPAAGPLVDLPVLRPVQQSRLTVSLKGTPSDLAYDAASDTFLVTTQQGIYLLDSSLQKVQRYTVVDSGYSVDLGTFTAATFLDSKTVMAVGDNKSYVVLKVATKANADKNFRYFLESFDAFDEQSRGRFTTVRARMMYTMSAAFDPAGKSVYTLTVPNAKVKRLVVSRFDAGDLTLSEEFMPKLDKAAGLRFRGEKRSLDELYLTGAAVSGGKLYAISAAYGTLITIDLASHQVVDAVTVTGVSHPTGLAVKGNQFYIVSEDGTVSVVEREVAQ